MKRQIWFLPGLIMLLTACSGLPTPLPAETATFPIVVTDALGREVTLTSPPQRIVITGKALVLVADAVYTFPQASARVAALGKFSQGSGNFIALIDPAYADKAIIEQDASAEQVAALAPDLVILKSYLAETVGKPIETVGIPVVYVDFETPEQYSRDLAILGQVFRDEERAQEVAAYYQSGVEQVQAAIEGVEKTPRVLMLYHSDRDGGVAFSVPPMSWMQTRLVELAGGIPVWADANPGKGWAQVTLEQVAAWDADHIFVISYNQDAAEVVVALKNDPQWQSLHAARNGQLHAFPADLYSWDQSDTRWILGLIWLAGRLHPERFPDLDIESEARQFYETLYGLDQAFFDQHIRPAFKGDLP